MDALTSGSPIAASELFDPVASTWTPTGSLNTARTGSAVVSLFDGRVLRAGGTPIAGLAPERIAARGVARTFQHGRVFGGLTIVNPFREDSS